MQNIQRLNFQLPKDAVIYIAGHRGMVGSAVWRCLEQRGYTNLVGFSRAELDLTDGRNVRKMFSQLKPRVVIAAAARVGGIQANNVYPYEFINQNLQIQNNLIDSAKESNVERFVFLGSSCIYPRICEQPIQEDMLLTGPLEPTNQWYAIAKIAGLKACEAIRKQYGKYFISLMPTNLYGPNDNFDLETAHVLPALIRKFHEAKLKGNGPVTLWGTGAPMREFLHVDDLAEAIRFAIENKLPDSLYNVGSGWDLSIMALASIVQENVGHSGLIFWDDTKPDGTPRKLMDSRKLKDLGWGPTIHLYEGIRSTYNWFLSRHSSLETLPYL